MADGSTGMQIAGRRAGDGRRSESRRRRKKPGHAQPTMIAAAPHVPIPTFADRQVLTEHPSHCDSIGRSVRRIWGQARAGQRSQWCIRPADRQPGQQVELVPGGRLAGDRGRVIADVRRFARQDLAQDTAQSEYV
jgi:hypothetical protein